MVGIVLTSLVLIIIAQRLFELWLAQRNRARALAAGGQEYGAGHYPLIVGLHSLWLIAWIGETLLGGPKLDPYWVGYLVLVGLAQGLRYWAIATLGPAWNTRIIVIPGSDRVRRGPYRFIPHPNYVAVTIELFCVPMIFGAWITALSATLVNAIVLLGIRIPAENRALQSMD